LAAGSIRVPKPAAGMTAFLMFIPGGSPRRHGDTEAAVNCRASNRSTLLVFVFHFHFQ
jgi:hypothetical protein